MKFHLLRPALVLASSLVLASCGGGGSETYPVKVTVSNVLYKGLILTTNGQELAVDPAAKAGDTVVLNFPKGLDYGTYYNVIPKGGTAAGGGGSQPAHQNCITNGYPREYGTAGQTASLESARTPAIEVFYNCDILKYELSGTITGLDSADASITLINGSNSQTTVTGNATTVTTNTPIKFALSPVAFGTSFGVSILTQPKGYTCTIANNTGTMDADLEAKKGKTDVAVTCTKSS
jgi:hypothetical protein